MASSRVTLVSAIRNFNTNAPNRDVLSIGFGTGGLTFQPSELLKICLVIFFAGYLSENQEMLALARFKVGPFTLPPLKHLGPLLVMLGVALLMIIGVRELGLALLIFGLFLSMLYVASNRPMYVVDKPDLIRHRRGGRRSASSATRARAWISCGSAFDPAVEPNQGYQIVQGLISVRLWRRLRLWPGSGQPHHHSQPRQPTISPHRLARSLASLGCWR